jgi:hypothetical protein
MFTRPVVLAAAVAAGVFFSHTDAAGSITLKACSGWTNQFAPTTVSITPDPPVVGKLLNINLTGTLKESIQKGAKLVTTRKVGVFQISKSTSDLCGIQGVCSFPVGTKSTLVTTVDVPDDTPAGVTIKHRFEAFNADDSKLFCFETTLEFEST